MVILNGNINRILWVGIFILVRIEGGEGGVVGGQGMEEVDGWREQK